MLPSRPLMSPGTTDISSAEKGYGSTRSSLALLSTTTTATAARLRSSSGTVCNECSRR
jgi:hypothetical protein